MIFTKYSNTLRWFIIAASFAIVSLILWKTYEFFQHFKDEEKLMAAINFAEINSHKKKHAKLIDDVKNILLDLKKGKTIHPYELIDYLTEWLIKHIRNEDKRIGRAMEQYKSEHNDWDGSFI